MISRFLNELNTTELLNDISEFTNKVLNRIENGNINKSLSNIVWLLNKWMSLLIDYNTNNINLNLLNDEEYQQILNTVTKIININYYEFT